MFATAYYNRLEKYNYAQIWAYHYNHIMMVRFYKMDCEDFMVVIKPDGTRIDNKPIHIKLCQTEKSEQIFILK